MDGKVDFHRTYIEYDYGFGNLTGEHWIGTDQFCPVERSVHEVFEKNTQSTGRVTSAVSSGFKLETFAK